MYVVTVTFRVDEDFIAPFLTAMKQQAKDSLENEDHCHFFDVCQREDAPNEIFLYEIYTSHDSFQDHLATEHFRQFSETVSPWVKEKTVVTYAKLPL